MAVLAHGVAAVEEVKGGENKYLQIPGEDVYLDDLNYLALDNGDDFPSCTVGAQIPIDFGDISRSIGVAVGGVGGPGGGSDDGDGILLGGSLPSNWVYWNRNEPDLLSFNQMMAEQSQVCSKVALDKTCIID